MDNISFERALRPTEAELNRLKTYFEVDGSPVDNKVESWIKRFGGIDAKAIRYYQEDLSSLRTSQNVENASEAEEVSAPSAAELIREDSQYVETGWKSHMFLAIVWTASATLGSFTTYLKHASGQDDISTLLTGIGTFTAAIVAGRNILAARSDSQEIE